MKRKLLLLIPIVFLLAVLAFVIYLNPPATPVSFKFDAVKIDADCKERGTFTIELSGHLIEPYFEEPRLDLTVVPFDGLRSLYTSSSDSMFEGVPIKEARSGSYLVIECDTWDTARNDYIWTRIGFSSDYDRWAFYNLDDDECYVGSVSGDYSVQELCDFFKPLLPKRDNPVDLPQTLTMTKVDQQGNASLNYQLHLEGEKGESASGISYLQAKIASFDGITNIETVNNAESGLPEIHNLPGLELQYVTCSGWSWRETSAFVKLGFSPDLVHWLFYNTDDKSYFVGSLNPEATTQELYEYFKPLITGTWSSSTDPSDSLVMENIPTFPLMFTMTKVSANGNEKENFDITIEADAIEKQDGKLYLSFRIPDFDSHSNIIAAKSESDYAGEVHTKWDGYYYVYCFGANEWVRVCFDSEYDRWAIYSVDDQPFYVGSVSGKYTTEELTDYFRLN